MGEWMYRSTIFDIRVVNFIHAPAALTPGKETPVPIGEEVGWTPDPVWTTERNY
jgi:hypothetical protein